MVADEIAVSAEDTPLIDRSSESHDASTNTTHVPHPHAIGRSLPLPLTLLEYSQLMVNASTEAAVSHARTRERTSSGSRKCQSPSKACPCFARWGAPATCILIATLFMIQIKMIPPCQNSCSDGCSPANTCRLNGFDDDKVVTFDMTMALLPISTCTTLLPNNSNSQTNIASW